MSKTENAGHHVIILAAGRSLRLERLTRDRPKSLLVVDGRPILEHALRALAQRGFRRLTLVVGYLREQFIEHFGAQFEDIEIEYVINEDYARTERGFSLYRAKSSWIEGRRPIVFMDADNFFDAAMLDRVMDSGHDDVVLVDNTLETPDRDEELVRGQHGLVRGLYRGRVSDFPDCVGGFVGINRFSAAFTGGVYDYMDRLFEKYGRIHTYESVFDAFIKQHGWRLNYVETNALRWINVNHESDYEIAKEMAREMKGDAEA